MTTVDGPNRAKFQAATSWQELFTELSDGMTTSTFRVGVPEDPDAPTIFRTYFPPNFEVPPHTHACDYAEVILEGSQQVTRKWHYPGDIRIVKAGTAYGPLVAGPEGATVLLIFRDGRYMPVSLDGNDEIFADYHEGLPVPNST
jgi:hypothetical protein